MIKTPTAQEAIIDLEKATPAAEITYPLPDLPTLDWSWGYKYTRNEQTGELEQVPLTLLDILYPTGEEIHVAENWVHHWLAALLEMTLRLYLAGRGWLVMGNVNIHWGWRGVPPLAPDVAVMPGGHYPAQGESYHVGRHGPLPSFVVEITSPHDRDNDLVRKRWDYAAVRVQEYLIVDMWPNEGEAWRLIGYRLEGPLYQEIEPDAQGGLTLDTIGVRFVAVGQERVELYEAITGERLVSPDEAVVRAEAARIEAEARAEAESQARAEVEARLRELEAKFNQLKGGDSE